MLVVVWAILSFLGCEVAGYAFHRFLHTKWAGPLRTNHLVHHLDRYPPGFFLSDHYRKAGGADTFWPFFLVGLGLAGLTFWLTPLWFSLPVILNLALVGYLNDAVHESTHLGSSRWAKYQWFQRLRAAHEQHHENMTTNYGIFTFFTDRLMKTYVGLDSKAKTE